MLRVGEHRFSRRSFLRGSATIAGVSWAGPYLCSGAIGAGKPMTRKLGRTGFEVTTLGLGGQASLQWTPSGIEPEKIILKALDLGVNYFDPINIYNSGTKRYICKTKIDRVR